MKRFCAALSIALLLAQPLAAAPARIELPNKADTVIVPQDSGLIFSRYEDKNDGIGAIFKGQVTLTGTYFYGDNAYNDDSGTVDLSLYFKPDAATVARLPHLERRGKAVDVFITGAAPFAKALLSEAQLVALRKKGALYATGTVSIVVDDFQASVDCDAASFTARFVSLAKPGAIAMAALPDTSC